MPSTKMRTFQPFNVGIARNFVDLAAVFEGRSLMHRTLQLPWRAPRKRTKLPGGEQIGKSGGLFAQGSMPVNASFRKRSSSSGVHGGLPTTGVISSPELDSEAPSFRCLSNLVLQVVRLVIAAELA